MPRNKGGTARVAKLRTRLITFFLMTTLITFVTSIFSFYSAQSFIEGTDNLFNKSIELNLVYDNLSKAEKSLETYLATKSSESLTAYNRLSATLMNWSAQVQEQPFYMGQSLAPLNIARMIDTFLSSAASAIEAKRGRNIDVYVELFNKSQRTAELIFEAIDKQSVEQLRLSTSQYQSMSARINAMQVFNIGLVVVVLLVNTIMIFLFSKRFTEPITELVHSSQMVAQGKFDIGPPAFDTHDEITTLSIAFYKMVGDLKAYFAEITEKAELEVRLKEERERYLNMQGALRDAEFKALQSQINPHFIYNTINIGAQIAMLEGDDKTCVFLENVADIFRYNLRSMATPVSLREEIENIRAYMFVFKMRFAEMVEYREDVEQDDELLMALMPRLTLQPIVENAYKHGLSEMESGGRITLSVRREGAYAKIVVADNGAGMTRERIAYVLGSSGNAERADLEPGQKDEGMATGIGLHNIIERLRLSFGQDVLGIESVKGHGTKVILRLPLAAPEGYAMLGQSAPKDKSKGGV